MRMSERSLRCSGHLHSKMVEGLRSHGLSWLAGAGFNSGFPCVLGAQRREKRKFRNLVLPFYRLSFMHPQFSAARVLRESVKP